MSLWDTSPWSNFCDPHWKLICCNKWHPRTPEIFAPLQIAVGTHFQVRHGTKAAPVFLAADGEASWLLLPSSVSLVSGGTVQPVNTYYCILKVTVQVWNSQKKASINTNHSYHHIHLPKLVSSDLTIKLDLVLTSQIGRDGWKASWCNKTSTP